MNCWSRYVIPESCFFVIVRDVISQETPRGKHMRITKTSKLKNEYGVPGLVICLNQDCNFHHSLKTKKHTCMNEQRRQLQTTAFDKTPSKNRADAPHSCTVLKTKLGIKSIALGQKRGAITIVSITVHISAIGLSISTARQN